MMKLQPIQPTFSTSGNSGASAAASEREEAKRPMPLIKARRTNQYLVSATFKSLAISGTDSLEVPIPYIRPIFQAYVRGYTPKIWPYMGKYLQSIGSWRSPIDSLDRQIVVFVGVPQICGIRPSQHIPTIQWLGVRSGWGIHIHHIPYEIRSYLEFANHLIASD